MKLSQGTRNALFLAALLAIPLGGICAPFIYPLWWSLGHLAKETTDLREYRAILAQWSDSGLARHFPDVVPQSAKSARLFSRREYFHGGASFHLRLSLPAEEVVAAEKETAAQELPAATGWGPLHNVPIHPDRTDPTIDPSKPAPFQPSFRVYVLHAKRGSDRPPDWTHGSAAGVAVSRDTNEVVYWCESW